jgi:hypothetical protein
MNQLIHTLKTALTSSDNTARSQAEKQIKHYLDINPTEFFMNCLIIFQDDIYEVSIRQSAGAVASRFLNSKLENGNYYWDIIDKKSQEDIRKKLMNTLSSFDSVVIKLGASILETIAAIELPRGEWLSIIDLLK